MTQTVTYVTSKPELKVVDGKFRFTGQAKKIDEPQIKTEYFQSHATYDTISGRQRMEVFDYLKRAGLITRTDPDSPYNHTYSELGEAYSGPMAFSDDFSVGDRLEKVDEIVPMIDQKRLKTDLNDNGFAFLMKKRRSKKYRDKLNEKYIAGMDRFLQELVYQRISEEFGLDPVRHLNAHEIAECKTDKLTDYWVYSLEVVQKMYSEPSSILKIKNGRLDVFNDKELLTQLLAPIKISFIKADKANTGNRFIRRGGLYFSGYTGVIPDSCIALLKTDNDS